MGGIFKKYSVSLTVITGILVVVIALLAGGSLMVLRSMQAKAAHATAAVSVGELGKVVAAHLGRQPIVKSAGENPVAWSMFAEQVHALYSMERALQYVSVSREGVTLFHEQRAEPGAEGEDPYIVLISESVGKVQLRRELLDLGDEVVPVVVFTHYEKGKDGTTTAVEVGIRRDAVERERVAADYAIGSMFKVALVTVLVSFSVCVLLVVWMMRREHEREVRRREEEHLAFAGVMANGIVHDFRNPMSSLKLDVQMLSKELAKDGDIDTSKMVALSERAKKTVDRMDKVFEEFLYVSKPPTAERECLDVCGCVRECLEIIEPKIENSGRQLTANIPEERVNVLAYRASIHRAIMNVIVNAEQFASKEGGKIDVSVTRADKHALVEIMDDGAGVDPKDISRIFDMFETGRPGGTGLGLFFARTAVESSGGTISVRNRESGGACFEIRLALDEGEGVG